MASKPNERTIAETTFAPFKLAWRLTSALVLMWLVSSAAQMVYVHHKKLDPAAHIQAQIDYYLTDAPASDIAPQMGTWTLELLVERWQLHRWRPPAQGHEPGSAVAPLIKFGIWVSFEPQLHALIYNTILYAVKLGLAISLVPIYLAWVAAFAVDGWVQRHIRRACGGYESASIYHRAKLYGTRLLLPFSAVVFFCSPIALSALLVFAPTALLSALLIRLQATYYKKYL
jgi:hypothetical protein